ncbi:MAG: diguanylate cyclase, partial [Candidimonas sp.]
MIFGVIDRLRPALHRWGPHAWRPGLFVLVLLLGLAVYWALLHSSHTKMQEQESADMQRLAGQTAQALALQINTVVRKLDYFSQHLSWVWLHSDMTAFNDAARVAIQTLSTDALTQIAVADAQGQVVYSNLNWPLVAGSLQPPVSIADREHFQVHVHADGPEFFISDPIKGRISQQWTIQFTRGMWENGQFMGVMVLAVSADHLTTALKAIFPDQIDAASLVKDDGTYLARSYHLAEALGQVLPSDRPFVQQPQLSHGTYEAVAAVDQIRRLYSWQRAEDYPVVILVGLGMEKAMDLTDEAINDSHWQSGAGSALLLLAGLSLAGLWVQRSMRSTQLQQVADALRTSEGQLRVTLDAVRDGLWEFDHTTRTVHWDTRIRNMLGYGDGYSALPLSALLQLIHPSDIAGFENVPALESGVGPVMNLEFRLRKADGRWRWVRARGGVIECDADGAPVRSVGTLSDISEQVAEAHLRDALLNRSAAAILLVSPDRQIVDANAQFTSVFLQPGQTLRTLDPRRLHVDAADWENMATAYDTVKTKGRFRAEHPFKDATGRIRWFDTSAVLQDPDDPESNIIWTWIDISRRHRADAALAIERSRLRTVLECFPGGVLIEDAEGNVVFSNPLWPQLLGPEIPTSAEPGMPDDEYRQRLGWDVAAWLRSRCGEGEPGEIRSLEINTLHGLHLEIDHIAVRHDQQNFGSVWLVRDITSRKQHELKLTQLASTDTLTKLPNRRSFMFSLDALHAEAMRTDAAVGVIMMLDIDRFKRVNDTFGHAVGDIVLQHIARLIKTALRATDVAGRIGGEEFAVLLPNSSVAAGQVIAERIRRSVEDACIDGAGHEIRVTIS